MPGDLLSLTCRCRGKRFLRSVDHIDECNWELKIMGVDVVTMMKVNVLHNDRGRVKE